MNGFFSALIVGDKEINYEKITIYSFSFLFSPSGRYLHSQFNSCMQVGKAAFPP